MLGSIRLLYVMGRLLVLSVNRFLVEMYTGLGSCLTSSECCHSTLPPWDTIFVPCGTMIWLVLRAVLLSSSHSLWVGRTILYGGARVPDFPVPSGIVEDLRDWTNWLLYRGGIGVKGEESWEAWWDEKLTTVTHSDPDLRFCSIRRPHSATPERKNIGDYFKSEILHLPVWHCLQARCTGNKYFIDGLWKSIRSIARCWNGNANILPDSVFLVRLDIPDEADVQPSFQPWLGILAAATSEGGSWYITSPIGQPLAIFAS
ncbi:hypothetical protein HRI_003489100 [Hibiscus trionum]|uniref:Uncharacterized protein n=1 Tax=Hibiscus trionum TaxID=183268 RepID=A0A9W7IQC6_HIBTR|nr:hypothetical protein HRI_003489100 [Hibiscus trionum]